MSEQVQAAADAAQAVLERHTGLALLLDSLDEIGHFLGKQTLPHSWLLVPQLDHSAVLLVLDRVTAYTTF